MVNGLRHYPVANAVAQTFPHPVILNETGLPAALTKAAATDRGYCSRKMIRAFVRSYGDSSTETLSPGTMRMKCLRILPEICASTLRWPGKSTRNIVPGNTCVTVPSVTICSSFAIARNIIAGTLRSTRGGEARLPTRNLDLKL